MAYYYCIHCKRVFGCAYLLAEGRKFTTCAACKEPCGMAGRYWKVAGFTFREDDHNHMCLECDRVMGPKEE